MAALGEAARGYLAAARDVLLTAAGKSLSDKKQSNEHGRATKKSGSFLSAINPLARIRGGVGKKKDAIDQRAGDASSSIIAEIQAAWDGGAVLTAALARVEEAANACRRQPQQWQQQTERYGGGGDATTASSPAAGVEAVAHRLRYGAGDGFFAVKGFVEATLARLEEERALRAAYEDAAADFTEWSAAAADRFNPDELPNNLPTLAALYADLRRFSSHEKAVGVEKMQRCVTLREAVAAAAAPAAAAAAAASSIGGGKNMRSGPFSAAAGIVGDDADAADPSALVEERQMAEVEAVVERRTADLVYELKRHHALADATRRFTSDAAELLDWLARQKRLLDSVGRNLLIFFTAADPQFHHTPTLTPFLPFFPSPFRPFFPSSSPRFLHVMNLDMTAP